MATHEQDAVALVTLSLHASRNPKEGSGRLLSSADSILAELPPEDVRMLVIQLAALCAGAVSELAAVDGVPAEELLQLIALHMLNEPPAS